MKYKDWIEQCIEIYMQPRIKGSTLQRYRQTINLLVEYAPELLEKEVATITNMDLQSILIKEYPRQYSKSSLKKIRSLFVMTFKRAYANNLSSTYPCIGLYIPESATEKKITALTITQQEIVEDIAKDDPLGHIVFFFLYTGLREDELINLKWSDVDLKNGWLYVRKSKTDAGVRRVPLIKTMQQLLYTVPKISTDEFVFHTTRGMPISRSSLTKLYLRMRKNTGISTLSNHIYRHTFATRAIEKGMDVNALSKILGHTDTAFTYRQYVHPDYNFLKNQMDVFK